MTFRSLLRWIVVAGAASVAVLSLRSPNARWAYLAGSLTVGLIVWGFLQAWLGGPRRNFWFGFSAAAASVALFARADLPTFLELITVAADADLPELLSLRWLRLDRLSTPPEAFRSTVGAYTVLAVGAGCGWYVERAVRRTERRHS
jgi:hypothetical protein